MVFGASWYAKVNRGRFLLAPKTTSFSGQALGVMPRRQGLRKFDLAITRAVLVGQQPNGSKEKNVGVMVGCNFRPAQQPSQNRSTQQPFLRVGATSYVSTTLQQFRSTHRIRTARERFIQSAFSSHGQGARTPNTQNNDAHQSRNGQRSTLPLTKNVSLRVRSSVALFCSRYAPLPAARITIDDR